jgi:hypothetical protein
VMALRLLTNLILLLHRQRSYPSAAFRRMSWLIFYQICNSLL